MGIIFPMINTAEDAAKAVSACRYPPHGERSLGPIGAIGIVVPGLPTVVFWILAAWLWTRSAPHRLERLLGHPRFGATIGNFLHHGVLARRDKRAALIGITLGYAVFLLAVQPSLAGALGMAALLAAVALWLLRRPEHSPLLPRP